MFLLYAFTLNENVMFCPNWRDPTKENCSCDLAIQSLQGSFCIPFCADGADAFNKSCFCRENQSLIDYKCLKICAEDENAKPATCGCPQGAFMFNESATVYKCKSCSIDNQDCKHDAVFRCVVGFYPAFENATFSCKPCVGQVYCNGIDQPAKCDGKTKFEGYFTPYCNDGFIENCTNPLMHHGLFVQQNRSICCKGVLVCGLKPWLIPSNALMVYSPRYEDDCGFDIYEKMGILNHGRCTMFPAGNTDLIYTPAEFYCDYDDHNNQFTPSDKTPCYCHSQSYKFENGTCAWFPPGTKTYESFKVKLCQPGLKLTLSGKETSCEYCGNQELCNGGSQYLNCNNLDAPVTVGLTVNVQPICRGILQSCVMPNFLIRNDGLLCLDGKTQDQNQRFDRYTNKQVPCRTEGVSKCNGTHIIECLENYYLTNLFNQCVKNHYQNAIIVNSTLQQYDLPENLSRCLPGYLKNLDQIYSKIICNLCEKNYICDGYQQKEECQTQQLVVFEDFNINCTLGLVQWCLPGTFISTDGLNCYLCPKDAICDGIDIIICPEGFEVDVSRKQCLPQCANGQMTENCTCSRQGMLIINNTCIGCPKHGICVNYQLDCGINQKLSKNDAGTFCKDCQSQFDNSKFCDENNNPTQCPHQWFKKEVQPGVFRCRHCEKPFEENCSCHSSLEIIKNGECWLAPQFSAANGVNVTQCRSGGLIFENDCIYQAKDGNFLINSAFNSTMTICRGFLLGNNNKCTFTKLQRPKEICSHLDDIITENCTCKLNAVDTICRRWCEVNENMTSTGCLCDINTDVIIRDDLCIQKPLCIHLENYSSGLCKCRNIWLCVNNVSIQCPQFGKCNGSSNFTCQYGYYTNYENYSCDRCIGQLLCWGNTQPQLCDGSENSTIVKWNSVKYQPICQDGIIKSCNSYQFVLRKDGYCCARGSYDCTTAEFYDLCIGNVYSASKQEKLEENWHCICGKEEQLIQKYYGLYIIKILGYYNDTSKDATQESGWQCNRCDYLSGLGTNYICDKLHRKRRCEVGEYPTLDNCLCNYTNYLNQDQCTECPEWHYCNGTHKQRICRPYIDKRDAGCFCLLRTQAGPDKLCQDCKGPGVKSCIQRKYWIDRCFEGWIKKEDSNRDWCVKCITNDFLCDGINQIPCTSKMGAAGGLPTGVLPFCKGVIIDCVEPGYFPCQSGMKCCKCSENQFKYLSSCIECPENATCNGVNLLNCGNIGEYFNEKLGKCMKCPSEVTCDGYLVTSKPCIGSNSCNCQEGYYAKNNTICQICQYGMLCYDSKIQENCSLAFPSPTFNASCDRGLLLNCGPFSIVSPDNRSCKKCPGGAKCDGLNVVYCVGSNIVSDDQKNCQAQCQFNQTASRCTCEGYVENSTNNCLQCPINCLCNGENITQCPPNLVLRSDGKACLTCLLGGICDSNGVFLHCQEHLVLIGDVCVTCENPISQACRCVTSKYQVNDTCADCPASAKCNGLVFECIQPYIMHENGSQCVKICKPGQNTIIDSCNCTSLVDENGTCQLRFCSDGENSSFGYCICDAELQYQTNNVCTACLKNAVCDGENFSCTPPFSLRSNGKCQKDCNFGAAKTENCYCNSGFVYNDVCYVCYQEGQCENESIISCPENLRISENRSICLNCSIDKEDTCLCQNYQQELLDGCSCSVEQLQYLGACIPCPQYATCFLNQFNCSNTTLKADNDTMRVCLLCPELALCNGSNQFSCQTGTFSNQQTKLCEICVDENHECLGGNFLCKEGFLVNFEERKCKLCPTNGICQGNDIFVCSNGFLQVLSSQICIDCPENATCDGSQTFVCNASYQYIEEQDKCMQICQDAESLTSNCVCDDSSIVYQDQCYFCPALAECVQHELVSCKNNFSAQSTPPFCSCSGLIDKENTCRVCPDNATCDGAKILTCADGQLVDDSGLLCKTDAKPMIIIGTSVASGLLLLLILILFLVLCCRRKKNKEIEKKVQLQPPLNQVDPCLTDSRILSSGSILMQALEGDQHGGVFDLRPPDFMNFIDEVEGNHFLRSRSPNPESSSGSQLQNSKICDFNEWNVIQVPLELNKLERVMNENDPFRVEDDEKDFDIFGF